MKQLVRALFIAAMLAAYALPALATVRRDGDGSPDALATGSFLCTANAGGFGSATAEWKAVIDWWGNIVSIKSAEIVHTELHNGAGVSVSHSSKNVTVGIYAMVDGGLTRVGKKTCGQ